LRLFEVPDPLPRVWLASEWEAAPNAAQALLRTLAPGFPLGKRIVLEQSPGAAVTGDSGQIAAVEYDQNRIRVRTTTAGPMVLVVNDRHYPGWTVRVNGDPAAMLRASGIFRAVVVPAGDSVVEMKFQPTGLLTGGICSLVGLVAFGFLSLAPSGRRSMDLVQIPRERA
jgi:hypothetical protein